MYKVTVIGGGTGSFSMLTGLRNYPDVDLAAIVTMTDDGGSSGILRDELGVLPPGDVRQCLVALADAKDLWRRLFAYRFSQGSLAGQNFGNLFISALEKITGSFENALDAAGEMLQVKGRVIPVTLDDVRLIAETTDGRTIRGEHQIDLKEAGIKRIYFEPEPSANPAAVRRILESDAVVIGPGDIYTSILPNILVQGIKTALRDTNGVKVYVCNIMTQRAHTHGLTVKGFVDLLERQVDSTLFDVVVYNEKMPNPSFLESYAREGEFPVKGEESEHKGSKVRYKGYDLLSEKVPQQVPGDKIMRALIRHDPLKAASAVYNICKEGK